METDQRSPEPPGPATPRRLMDSSIIPPLSPSQESCEALNTTIKSVERVREEWQAARRRLIVAGCISSPSSISELDSAGSPERYTSRAFSSAMQPRNLEASLEENESPEHLGSGMKPKEETRSHDLGVVLDDFGGFEGLNMCAIEREAAAIETEASKDSNVDVNDRTTHEEVMEDVEVVEVVEVVDTIQLGETCGDSGRSLLSGYQPWIETPTSPRESSEMAASEGQPDNQKDESESLDLKKKEAPQEEEEEEKDVDDSEEEKDVDDSEEEE